MRIRIIKARLEAFAARGNVGIVFDYVPYLEQLSTRKDELDSVAVIRSIVSCINNSYVAGVAIVKDYATTPTVPLYRVGH